MTNNAKTLTDLGLELKVPYWIDPSSDEQIGWVADTEPMPLDGIIDKNPPENPTKEGEID